MILFTLAQFTLKSEKKISIFKTPKNIEFFDFFSFQARDPIYAFGAVYSLVGILMEMDSIAYSLYNVFSVFSLHE